MKKLSSLFLFFILFTFHTNISQADTACGIGSTCTGSTRYLKIGRCDVSNANAPSNAKVDCYNADLQPYALHQCPVGGPAGSCVAFAEGKNGCGNVTATYTAPTIGTNCRCSTTGLSCTGHQSDCGWTGTVYGTCDCDTSGGGWSCPAPAGGPLGCCYTPATYCGDGMCNGIETSTTCPQDCGLAGGPTPPPAAVCGDGACNGSETQASCPIDCGYPGSPPPFCGDGACNATETCSTCGTDCGSCASPQFCGDGICSATESCTTCSQDCGVCSGGGGGGGGFCGDSMCSAFETCDSCSADCGACPVDLPWWQVRGGNVYAGSPSSPAIRSLIPGSTCIEPGCTPELISQISGLLNGDTDGIIITGGGSVQTNGFYTPRDLVALNTQMSRYKEGYDFFYRKSDLGLTPIDSFSSQSSNAQKPSSNGVYFRRGNLTVQQIWNVAAGESYVIFVDGDLTITNNTDPNFIQVEEGGFLAFIVSGDILIRQGIGHITPTVASVNDSPNIEGVFIADGTITVQADGNLDTRDRRFVGAGSFIAWEGFDLQRDFTGFTPSAELHRTIATEVFIFRPDFVLNAPEFMLAPHSIWQETN